MKNSILAILILSHIAFATLFYSCDSKDDIFIDNSGSVVTTSDSMTFRSLDECEICIEQNACCCALRLQSIQTTSVSFTICGVVPQTNENALCTLSTGNGPCNTFSNRGINVTLDPNGQTIQYFCIAPGGSFAIHNLNSSGTGWVQIGCGMGDSTVYGSIGANISGGSVPWYFITDSECDLEGPCDF